MNKAVNERLQRRMRRTMAGATALVAALGGGGVLAADDATTLEEVTVTAQRREQNSREVPVSLTVFSAQAIEQQNFQGVDSYFAQTPNVSFISTGSRDRKQLSLRGVSDQLSPDSNIKQGSFGFYIDELNVAAGTSNPQIVDIDRIEILRGPQGTYFGRNSVGGAINITTKQPSNNFYGEAGLQYSSFNTLDAHAILNLPLVDDRLAVRIVGRHETSDGNIKNINPIGGGNSNKYTYGKTIIRFTPNDRLTIDLTGTASKENVGMRDGVPSGVLGTFSKTVLYAGPPYNGVAIPDGVGFWPQNTDEVNFNRKQDVGTSFNYVSNRVRYNADAFTVTNILGYIDSNEFLNGDIDGSSIDFFYEQESIKRSSLSEELRFQSVPGRAIDWTAGAIYARDIGHTRQFTYTGAQNPFGLPDGFEVTSSFSDATSRSYALFGEGVWHVDRRLAVTLGARYTKEKVEVDSYDTSSGTINNYVNGDASFSNFSPRLSLNYLAAERVNVYATIARGFKAGGLQASSVNNSYAPETLWNYEIGVKSELWEQRLQLNTSVFYMDWKNMQTEYAFAVSTGNGVQFQTGIGNAASARSYGLETEAVARVLPSLTLSAGAGYNKATFSDYKNAFADGQITDLTGKQLPNAPKWTLHADGEYAHNFGNQFEGFARLEWFYKGGIVPNLTSEVHSGFPWNVPSFNVWNLRAGVNNDSWSLNAFAENLFNKKYYTNAYEKAFAGGMFLEPSYRRFGVKIIVKTR